MGVKHQPSSSSVKRPHNQEPIIGVVQRYSEQDYLKPKLRFKQWKLRISENIFEHATLWKRRNRFKRRLTSTLRGITKCELLRHNAQSPYDLSRDAGTCYNIWLDDLSFREDFLMYATSSHKWYKRHIVVVYRITSMERQTKHHKQTHSRGRCSKMDGYHYGVILPNKPNTFFNLVWPTISNSAEMFRRASLNHSY